MQRLPAIVAGMTVKVPGGVMLPEAMLVLDVLVIRSEEERPTLVTGEVKTYPDRGGYTEGAQLAQARAQAGIYAHGLALVVDELELTNRITTSDQGFLVLGRPGSNFPSVRAYEDLHYQRRRAERGFARLRAVAERYGGNDRPDEAAVAIAPTAYCEACVTFCDLAPRCHDRALEVGDPAALGDDVARLLGEVTLFRAIELLGGAPPHKPAERDLLRRYEELALR
jgi:hypothetical protein